MASSDEDALLSNDTERDGDVDEDRASDPLSGGLVASGTNEASNKRLLLYAGPALLLWRGHHPTFVTDTPSNNLQHLYRRVRRLVRQREL